MNNKAIRLRLIKDIFRRGNGADKVVKYQEFIHSLVELLEECPDITTEDIKELLVEIDGTLWQ